MSLRVLLADESPSIKKAFELALKDLAVQIQTVHHGVDVKELCSSFNPDICFLDILLPKKNGYDACTEIKTSGKTTPPVVLMWSSFMEIDETKFKTSQADDRLEKPFETKSLRNIVSNHVQKLKSNQISQFIETEEVKDIQNQSDDSENQNHSEPPEENENLPPLGAEPENLQENNQTKDSQPPPLPEVPDLEFILDLQSDDTDESEEDHDGEGDHLKLDDHEEFQSLPSEFEVEEENNFEELSSLEDSDEDFFSTDSNKEGDQNDDDDDLDTFKMEPLESFNEESQDFESTPPPTFVPPPISDIKNQKETSPQPEPPSQSSQPEPPMDESFYQDNTDPSLDLDSDDSYTAPPPPPPLTHDRGEPASDPTTPPTPPLENNVQIDSLVENTQKSESGKNFSLDDQLSKDELKRLIMAQSKDIIENVVWEVVPELAKELIKKEIARLTGEIKPYEGREEQSE